MAINRLREIKKSEIIWIILFSKKLSFLILSVIISTTYCINAQTIQPTLKNSGIIIERDSNNRRVDIEFKAEKEIYNLLVVISDSSGFTMFLDNRYHFKGTYQHRFDFKEKGSGKYFLKIIKDEEEFNEYLNID